MSSILEGDQAAGQRIPGDCRELLAPWLGRLQAVHEALQARRERDIGARRELWLRMIRSASMEPGDQAAQHRLFVSHSFLVVLAQGVIHTLARPGQRPDPERLLEGGFESWVLEAGPGRRWARQFLDLVHGHDWRSRPGDVLRPLYEAFVGESDRRDFGEFYTPDWLAELMVEEVLDDEWCDEAVGAALGADSDPGALRGVGVLDPACGSGTFLYHAARRILGSRSLGRQKLDPPEQAMVAARLVSGIDIHPVAAAMARATVMRALPAEPPGGRAAIRVCQGDSLMVRHGDAPLIRLADGGSGSGAHRPSSDIREAGLVRSLADRKVDRIVANPPWLTLSGIQAEERKQELELFSREEARVWAGGKAAPHLDIAQLFVKRCRELYLASPRSDPAAWLVKKAAIRSQGWDRFRKWHGEILAQSLDLEDVQPFGGGDARRSCVLFECRPSAGLAGGGARELRASAGNGRPQAGATCEEALRLLDIRPAARSLPVEASGYCDPGGEPLFRQGATITPKVLSVARIALPGRKHGHLQATTALSRKRPWSGIGEQTGEFPEWWLRSLLASENLHPFAIAGELPRAVIPLAEDGMRLLEDPSKASQSWQRWEAIYREHRGKGRHTPGTLLGRIDYGRALSFQLGLKGRGRTLVVHPSSGDIMRAARMVPGQAVLDSTLYYLPLATAQEAAYLVGILNAPSLGAAFAESRTSGRHFHKNPWRKIPIARYDPENAVHQEIADLAVQAERAVLGLVAEDRNQGQVAISKRMRHRLAATGIFGRLDEAVRKALPGHAA